MAQFARPDSDVSNAGSWVPDTGTALWDKLDEDPFTTSGSDYITSPSNPGSPGAVCEVGLSDVTDPEVSSGHVVRYRYLKTPGGSRTCNFYVRLLQGATQIASWSHSAIGGGVSLVEQTLTGTEADAISDYTNLRLEFRAETTGGGSASGARVVWAEMEVPDSGLSVSPGTQPRPLTAVGPSRIDQVVSPGLLSMAASAVAPNMPTIVEPAGIGLTASDLALARIDRTAAPPTLSAPATPVAPSRIDQAVTATILAAAAAAVAPEVRFSVNPAGLSAPAVAQAPARVDTDARPGLISIPATVLAPAISIVVNPAALSVPAAAQAPTRMDGQARPGLISALASVVALNRVDQVVSAVALSGAASALAPVIQEAGGLTVSPGVITMPAAALSPRLDLQVIAQLLDSGASAIAPSIPLPGQEVAPATLATAASPIAFIRIDQGVSPAAIAAAAAAIAPAQVDTQVVAQLIAAAVGALAPEIADAIVSGGAPPAGSAVAFVAVGIAGPGTVPAGSASHSTPEH